MKLTEDFLIILLLSGVIASACISQAPLVPQVNQTPALTTVKIGYTPYVSNGPLFIAKEEGFFAEQGIHVEFEKFQSASAALPALINRDIAVSGGSISPGLINAIAKGAHVRIVADKGRVAPDFCAITAVMVRRDLFENGTVRKVSDLRGRKILASSGDQSYGLSRALATGNLTTDDVEVVNMDNADSLIAFENGAIDAGTINEPYLTLVLNSGSAVVLISGQDFQPDYPSPLFYGPAFMDTNPDLGNRFMVAYLKGVRQYNEGKTERNLEILRNYTHLDRDLLKQSCWSPIANDGRVPQQPVREYIDWMYANKKINQNLDIDEVFNMSYVNYANRILQNTTKSGQY
jgi:NitT/TauT family transport system substrate-binding protein